MRIAEAELSDRQLEILAGSASGLSTAEISAMLFLSRHTVNNYLDVARKKMGAKTTGQLIAWAVADGSLTVAPFGKVTVTPKES